MLATGAKPYYFLEYSVDVSGALEAFRFKDHNRESAQNTLVQRAEAETDYTWATRWVDLCKAADAALERLDTQLTS